MLENQFSAISSHLSSYTVKQNNSRPKGLTTNADAITRRLILCLDSSQLHRVRRREREKREAKSRPQVVTFRKRSLMRPTMIPLDRSSWISFRQRWWWWSRVPGYTCGCPQEGRLSEKRNKEVDACCTP